MLLLRDETSMKQSSSKGVYCITGWLLCTVLKAAKQRAKTVKEQLCVLAADDSFSRDTVIDNNNLPTVKVDMVENVGGLNYARFFLLHLYSNYNICLDTYLYVNKFYISR